ncbi:TetR/AcrR family transcriptional regulator [Trinickia diaoshuihuensis]|uniref:TetR/AcrR family transcriptional regulator n=1 Tax=Trinickia diaoshuihuensis TaxID=2292265 RepID=UPI000E23174C|nr:TetR/AcrR family transcriptional regulator [Trinickia diaoshuihuensis]
MASQNASRSGDDVRADAKPPRRERGRARVAALLDAAGAEFAEKGFDAATMTAIAARAGASIGSLYQFFPTKDVLADALLEAYLTTLIDDLGRLREAAPALDVAALAHRLARALVAFRAAHPAFAPLVETSGRSLPAVLGVRERIRAEIAAILRAKAPGMKAAEAQVRAAVVQQIMKAAVAIQGEATFAHRAAVIDELESVMKLYLDQTFEAVGLARASKR